MASKWTTATINEVAEKVGMGPFGSSIKVDTFQPDGIPIINGQHLRKIALEELKFNYISLEHAERLKSANVRRGDIVLTHRGNIGQVSYIPDSSRYERYVISQSQFYIRCNPQKAIPQYIVYYFRTREGQHKLLANRAQTGVPSIAQPVSYLRSIRIPLPPLPEQRAIAHILGTLDDKIELNRRTNETLEAIARTLFKSWFVDFDPVLAKAAGRAPQGMDAATDALFPDAFEDSELGELPKGWRVGKIGDAVTVVGGTTPSTKEPAYWDGAIPFATPKDMAALTSPALLDTQRHITEVGLQQIPSGLLPKGTVLLSSRAPIGYLAIAELPVTINQGFIGMICDRELPNYYVLHWTRTNMDTIIGNANGTTFLEISKGNFRPINVLLPPADILTHFVNLVEPFHQRMVGNLKESRSLAALRDTLLPKMLSGELRIVNIEN